MSGALRSMRSFALVLALILTLLSVRISLSQAYDQSLKVKVADALITSAFQIRPLFKMASKKARDQMVEQGQQIGVDWKVNVGQLQSDMEKLTTMYGELDNSKTLVYPGYYLKPFHAYDDGNLSWQAAMEVESAALTVHAKIYVKEKNDLDELGDFTLRDNFHINMRQIFEKHDFKPTKILDIGCSTGLSTIKLHNSFQDAEVIGLDLSPYMLSVAKLQLSTLPALADARGRVSYLHASGEQTSLGKGDVDCVSMSLVSHELPESASKDMFQHAFDLLPSGGALSIMDMNPQSPFFRKFASNPFAFAAFKSTEPWIQEYVGMDIHAVLKECGFGVIEELTNSPRHRTIVAFKR